MGGDHSFKFGGYWRDNDGYDSTHTPGNAVARFPTSPMANPNDCATQAIGCQMQLTRDGQTDVPPDRTCRLRSGHHHARHHSRCSSALRVRPQPRSGAAPRVAANPLMPRLLPAVTFAGADPGVVFNNVSPRLGFTYDSTIPARRVVHGNYAMYWGQVGVGGLRRPDEPGHARQHPVSVGRREPRQVRPGERDHHSGQQHRELPGVDRQLESAARGSPTTANTIDPNLKNDQTQEFIVGVDREIGAGFAVGANYIWRKYSNFQFIDTVGLSRATTRRRPSRRRPRPAPVPTATVSARGIARRSATIVPHVPGADDQQPHDLHTRSVQPRLQRRGSHGTQADVEPLADEHELRVQQHGREHERVGR